MDHSKAPDPEPVERMTYPRLPRAVDKHTAELREKRLTFVRGEQDTVGLERRKQAADLAEDNEAIERLVQHLTAVWGA